jgi:outer membrane cobalamin receptor
MMVFRSKSWGSCRLLCYALALGSSAAVGFGQVPVNLAGVVRDARTGQPLAEATALAVGTGHGTSTDASGHFEIRGLPSGQYSLQISRIGYEDFVKSDVSIFEGETTFLVVPMHPAIITLPPVTVSADLDVTSRRPSVSVVRGRELTLGGVTDVADAVGRVPGVTVLEEGGQGGRKTVSIRGCRPDQVIVELDGVPINPASGGAVDLSQFPSDRVEQIEIVRGGESASAGSGALGGVIRITTHKPDRAREASTMKVSANGGSFGYGEAAVQVRVPWSPPSFEFYVRHARSKGDFTYYERGVEKTRINNHHERWMGQISGSWQLDDYWRWQGQFSAEQRDRGSPGLILQAPTPDATLQEQPIRISSRLAWQRSRDTVTLTNFYNFQKREYRSPRDQYDPTTGQTYYHAPVWTEDEDRQWGGSLVGSFAVGKEASLVHRLSAGIHFRHDQYFGTDRLGSGSVSDRSIGRVHRNTLSSNGKVDCNLPGRLSHLQWGAIGRVDAVDQTELDSKIYPTGRMHLTWAPLKEGGSSWKLIASGSYGSSYRLPSFVSLFLVESEFALGNRELRPERGRDGDVGVLVGFHRDEPAWFQGVEACATAFWSRIEDMVVWRPNFRGQYYPDNLAAADVKGIELSAQISLFDESLVLDGHATLQRACNKTPDPRFEGKVLPLQPEAQGGASIQWFPVPFEVTLDYRAMGRRYTTEDNTDPLSTAARDLKAFSVLGASIGWQKTLRLARIKLLGRVDNLMDKDYMIIERSPMPGRSYEIQLSIEK